MRLEYRILEIAQGDEQECNFCFLDFDDPTLLNFDTAPATHQMVAHNTPDGYTDIVFICSECKKDYNNNTLPWCEKCGRLKRNRNRCFCSHLKAKSTKPLSDKELLSQTFSFRLENKTRELEKELSITKEELKIEREEIAKFQEKSEEWGKRQKQELLDKIKQQEAEIIKLTQKIEQLKTLTPQELVNKLNAYETENEKLKNQLEQLQQNGQLTAQIEVKEAKKWPWLKIRK